MMCVLALLDSLRLTAEIVFRGKRNFLMIYNMSLRFPFSVILRFCYAQ